MVSMVERHAAALFGFGFVALAVTAGVTAALLAGVGGLAAYCLVALGLRRRLKRFTDEFIADEVHGRHDARARTRTAGRSRRAA